jgi:hypothetical protein
MADKTLVALRIPNELLEKIDAKGTRTDVILQALQFYLREVINPTPDRTDVIEGGFTWTRPLSHDPKTCRIYGCLLCRVAKT